MSTTIDMYTSCEYVYTKEELEELEKISAQYDAMVKAEEDKWGESIGYCGFYCNYGCSDCASGVYDGSDE